MGGGVRLDAAAGGREVSPRERRANAMSTAAASTDVERGRIIGAETETGERSSVPETNSGRGGS